MQKGYILIAVLLLGLASANFWQVTKEFKSDSFNAAVLDSWTVEGFNQPFVSNCQKTFVGGPGIAAKSSILKVFETPFELSEINIEVDIGLFDNWATGWEGGKNQNQVAIFVNDVNVYQIGSDETRQLHSQGTNFCGGNARDRWTKASFTVPVTGKQFVVKFVGVFADGSDPNHSSWGIRELYILASVGKSNAVLLVDELNDVNFNSEVWSATNVGNNKFSQCGGKSILGGYTATAGATFVRSISAIPPHSFLTIELDAYFLDSLDRNDSIVFSVDGKIVLETSKTYHDATTNICGLDRVNDLIKHLKIQVPHFSSNAEVKIYVNCDQGVGDESFGFNNFQVTASLPCPIIYSENNQRGKLLSFCGDIPNLLEIGWTYPIKGIYVPEGYKLTVFENSKYSGKRYSVTQSNFNLSGNDYVLINKAFKVQRY